MFGKEKLQKKINTLQTEIAGMKETGYKLAEYLNLYELYKKEHPDFGWTPPILELLDWYCKHQEKKIAENKERDRIIGLIIETVKKGSLKDGVN